MTDTSSETVSALAAHCIRGGIVNADRTLVADTLRALTAERDALRKEWLETDRALQQRTLQAAKAEGERDALRAAIGSALWEHDHSREDNAEVNYEMGRILRAAYNSTMPEKTAV